VQALLRAGRLVAQPLVFFLEPAPFPLPAPVIIPQGAMGCLSVQRAPVDWRACLTVAILKGHLL